MCEYCIDIDVKNIKLIKKPTQKICEYAYNKDQFYVNFLKTPTIGQYMEAFKADTSVLAFGNCVIDL
jgi:hypothetical protein